jgi:hypothetical protein
VDVLAPRDAWMHRVDLARATDHQLAVGDADRAIVAQVVRDLGLAWTSPPVLLELTGPAGGAWALGVGPPVTTIRADAIEYMRTLAGRNNQPVLEVRGNQSTAALAAAARVLF